MTENLLGCILASCSTYANEALFEICKLGEEISPKLIEIFRHKNSNQQIKESIADFFEIQICLHRKITTVPVTAWEKLLQPILDTLLDELNMLTYQKVFKKYENISFLKLTVNLTLKTY